MFSLEKITKYLLYLTLLIPPLSLAGSLLFPFVSGKAYLFRLGVELALFFWVILLVKKPEYRPNFKNLLVISGFAYILAMSVTALLGVDPIHSFFSEIERADGVIQFVHWYLYFLMLISVLRDRKAWDYFLKAFLALAAYISFFAWGQHFSSSQFFFYGHTVGRLEGTFGNPDYLPAFLLFALGYTIYYFFETLREKKGAYKMKASSWLSLFAFFFLTFLFTQTRGAYIGFLAGFLFLTVFLTLYLRKEHKKIVLSFWLIILLGAISWAGIFAFRNKPFVKDSHLLHRLVDVTPKTSSSLEGRLLTWKIAWAGFRNRPLFGWGPENFAAAYSRFYYVKGTKALTAWFDKVHNQFLQVLVEGGIFQFTFYLFWIFSVFYLIFRPLKKSKNKIIPIVLGSIYLSFLVQDFFLFDTFPLYLGLWPFLGFVYFNYEESKKWVGERLEKPFSSGEMKPEKKGNPSKNLQNTPRKLSWISYILYPLWSVAILFLLIESVWLPYKSNRLIRDYSGFIISRQIRNRYVLAKNILEKAIKIDSPYTLLDARKRGGWGILGILNAGLANKKDKSLLDLYKYVTRQMEIALKRHPYDPQNYYILGDMYSLGSAYLGVNDFAKAQSVLERGLAFSPRRLAYIIPLARTYILMGEYKKAEFLMKEYAYKYEPNTNSSHLLLGTVYLLEKKYDLAAREYDLVRKRGYRIWRDGSYYAKYVVVCAELKRYKDIVKTSEKRVESFPRDPRAWFDLAYGYKKLGNNGKAKEAFEKASELNSNYQKFSKIFE